jgi:hypothetical protein
MVQGALRLSGVNSQFSILNDHRTPSQFIAVVAGFDPRSSFDEVELAGEVGEAARTSRIMSYEL